MTTVLIVMAIIVVVLLSIETPTDSDIKIVVLKQLRSHSVMSVETLLRLPALEQYKTARVRFMIKRLNARGLIRLDPPFFVPTDEGRDNFLVMNVSITREGLRVMENRDRSLDR